MDILDELLKKVTDLGFGAFAMSREKVEQKVKEWTDSEHISPAQAKRVMQELIKQGEEERTELVHMIQDQVQKTLTKFGVVSENTGSMSAGATEEYVRRLEERIAELEQKLGMKPEADGERLTE